MEPKPPVPGPPPGVDVHTPPPPAEPGSGDPPPAAPTAPDYESDANPYKKRFGDSTREVTETLLPKIAHLEEAAGTHTTEMETLTRERDELNEKLKKEKPETFDNVGLRRSLEKNAREMAELKESVEIDSFIVATPAAAQYRDALRQHARAHPKKSLPKIWEDGGFKARAEAAAEKKKSDDERQRAGQGEGGGTTAEPGKEMICGMTPEAFNKLSVAKRRELLVKANIQP